MTNEEKSYFEGSKNPKDIYDTVKHNILFARNNPDYFYPAGIWVFCGKQGSGKTLSAVQTVQKLCRHYPKAKLISNLEIKGIDQEVIPFTSYEQIKNETNGINGIIFLIDEIQTIWNSLESKEIPISEMAAFCQMRKDRRVIIGTSQVRSRIAKPIREQLQYIIDCSNYFKLIQVNSIMEPIGSEDVKGQDAEKLCTKIWFHSPELYKSYETLNKIEKIKRKEVINYGSLSKFHR